MIPPFTFPTDFLWGAATSAYQIEGSPLADGAGLSNWHRFASMPHTIAYNDTGAGACDHYHRFREDIQWMQIVGLRAYRFSFAWSRLFPEGRGQVNSKGLTFYQTLLDALESAKIIPCVTLHHWDMPAALEDKGGWAFPDASYWFSEYAHKVFRLFRDRIQYWITINEPGVIVQEGYLHGNHPPGERSPEKAWRAVRSLCYGHGLAVQAFRADGQGSIGWAVHLEPHYPATDAPQDRFSAEKKDIWTNKQFLDPILLGRYPETLIHFYGKNHPPFSDEESRIIASPIDFIGINYYRRVTVVADSHNPPFFTREIYQNAAEYTEMKWEVYPEGLTRCLLWVKQRYGDIPLFITENGAAFDDPAPEEECILDVHRIRYLRSHLQAAHDALRQGVSLKGYFVWSLLDNFEWTFGFSKRFGLIAVDFHTQKRTLKASGRWYRHIIDTQGKGLWE